MPLLLLGLVQFVSHLTVVDPNIQPIAGPTQRDCLDLYDSGAERDAILQCQDQAWPLDAERSALHDEYFHGWWTNIGTSLAGSANWSFPLGISLILLGYALMFVEGNLRKSDRWEWQPEVRNLAVRFATASAAVMWFASLWIASAELGEEKGAGTRESYAALVVSLAAITLAAQLSRFYVGDPVRRFMAFRRRLQTFNLLRTIRIVGVPGLRFLWIALAALAVTAQTILISELISAIYPQLTGGPSARVGGPLPSDLFPEGPALVTIFTAGFFLVAFAAHATVGPIKDRWRGARMVSMTLMAFGVPLGIGFLFLLGTSLTDQSLYLPGFESSLLVLAGLNMILPILLRGWLSLIPALLAPFGFLAGLLVEIISEALARESIGSILALRSYAAD